MAWLSNVLQLLQVIAALGVVILVLLQHGKGADMGAAFGSGSSGSLFGATGSANFLSRATAGFATVFFVATLGLAYFASQRPEVAGSLMESAPPTESTVPATTVPAGGATSDPSVPSAPTQQPSTDANTQIPASTGSESTQGSGIPK